MFPVPAEPLTSGSESLGTVEIGGTGACVVESTSGSELATPTAPAATRPSPSAEAAEIEIQRGAGGMSVLSRRFQCGGLP